MPEIISTLRVAFAIEDEIDLIADQIIEIIDIRKYRNVAARSAGQNEKIFGMANPEPGMRRQIIACPILEL